MAQGRPPFMPGATLRACRQQAGMSVIKLAECVHGRPTITTIPRYRGNGARRQIESDIAGLERTERYPEPRYLLRFLTVCDECLLCRALGFLLARLALEEAGGPFEATLNDEHTDDQDD